MYCTAVCGCPYNLYKVLVHLDGQTHGTFMCSRVPVRIHCIYCACMIKSVLSYIVSSPHCYSMTYLLTAAHSGAWLIWIRLATSRDCQLSGKHGLCLDLPEGRKTSARVTDDEECGRGRRRRMFFFSLSLTFTHFTPSMLFFPMNVPSVFPCGFHGKNPL